MTKPFQDFIDEQKRDIYYQGGDPRFPVYPRVLLEECSWYENTYMMFDEFKCTLYCSSMIYYAIKWELYDDLNEYLRKFKVVTFSSAFELDLFKSVPFNGLASFAESAIITTY